MTKEFEKYIRENFPEAQALEILDYLAEVRKQEEAGVKFPLNVEYLAELMGIDKNQLLDPLYKNHEVGKDFIRVSGKN